MPAAAPLTAAITGFSIVIMLRSAGRKSVARRWLAGWVEAFSNSAKSAPAQKALPSPLRITQRTCGSAATVANASLSARAVGSLSALRTAGRAIVTSAIPPSVVTRRTNGFSSLGMSCSLGGVELFAHRLKVIVAVAQVVVKHH